MSLVEKSVYLKGLADGMVLDKSTKEGKLLAALLDLVDEMTHELADIREDIEEIDGDMEYLNDYVEELDDDLEAVENYLDEVDEEEDDEDDYEECDGNCEGCDGCDFDDEEFFEITCPSCGEIVCFNQETDPENLVCPACQEKFGCIVDEEDFKKIEE
ncbi:MAG: hypothetical protein IJW49_01665 [Clostridia bacterium]|nr:hypothetical protein [Clostridia bacterium]